MAQVKETLVHVESVSILDLVVSALRFFPHGVKAILVIAEAPPIVIVVAVGLEILIGSIRIVIFPVLSVVLEH